MESKSICRIGVFYDGSYFAYSQRYFYFNRKLGWLDFRALHSLIEDNVRKREQGYSAYRIVHAAWFQGLSPSSKMDERQLRFDRNLYHDLMHAGIEAKYLPISGARKEKGTDVALTVEALDIALAGKIDVAVLVSGDADFVPLVRELMKNGVRVMVVYFDYREGEYNSFANVRLVSACNYELNINSLEERRESKAAFRSLFKKEIPELRKPVTES